MTVLWRRVETISPDAYAELMAWVETHAADGAPWPWLELMTTNEVAVDAAGVLAEVARLRERRLPEPVATQAELLWDLIWEASEPASDWLQWRPCRVCGRRWATSAYEGVLMCPRHQNPAVLRDYLLEETRRYPGLVDHTARLAALTARLADHSLAAASPNGDHPSADISQAAPPSPAGQPAAG